MLYNIPEGYIFLQLFPPAVAFGKMRHGDFFCFQIGGPNMTPDL